MLPVITQLPASVPAAAPQIDPGRALLRRFVTAALVCTLTLGATFGAYNLLVIHLSLGPLPPAHQWAHAAFQVLGFVLLFIMGVAYALVPRLLGAPLRTPGAAAATFWLALAGVVLRAYAALDPLVPYGLPALVVSAALEFAAIVGFASVLARTARRAVRPQGAPRAALAAGLVGWVVATLFLCAGAAEAVRERDVAAMAAWNEAFYAAALFAGALPWVHGFLERAGPVLLRGIQPRSRATALLSFAGGIVTAAGLAPLGLPHALTPVGLAIVAAALLRSLRLRIAEGFADDTARLVRLGQAFGGVFAVLALWWAGWELLRGNAPRLLFDAARHAFALGFLTIIIFGMAGRLVPGALATRLRWPALRLWGARLIAAGAALRLVQVVAAISGREWPLYISGPTGVVAAPGVVLASISILGTVHGRGAVHAARQEAAEVVR